MKYLRWIDSVCCHVLRTMNMHVIIFSRVLVSRGCYLLPGNQNRIMKYLRQFDSSLLPRFKDEKHSCIIMSRVLTSGGVDRLICANQVKLSNTSDELIQFGCIGHGCKPFCYCFLKLRFWTWYNSFILILVLVFNSAALYLSWLTVKYSCTYSMWCCWSGYHNSYF